MGILFVSTPEGRGNSGDGGARGRRCREAVARGRAKKAPPRSTPSYWRFLAFFLVLAPVLSTRPDAHRLGVETRRHIQVQVTWSRVRYYRRSEAKKSIPLLGHTRMLT